MADLTILRVMSISGPFARGEAAVFDRNVECAGFDRPLIAGDAPATARTRTQSIIRRLLLSGTLVPPLRVGTFLPPLRGASPAPHLKARKSQNTHRASTVGPTPIPNLATARGPCADDRRIGEPERPHETSGGTKARRPESAAKRIDRVLDQLANLRKNRAATTSPRQAPAQVCQRLADARSRSSVDCCCREPSFRRSALERSPRRSAAPPLNRAEPDRFLQSARCRRSRLAVRFGRLQIIRSALGVDVLDARGDRGMRARFRNFHDPGRDSVQSDMRTRRQILYRANLTLTSRIPGPRPERQTAGGGHDHPQVSAPFPQSPRRPFVTFAPFCSNPVRIAKISSCHDSAG